jgi:hypothetical protein
MMAISVVYGLGCLVTWLRADAPPASRLALALLWPLGPLAGLVTLSALTVAAMIAFPIFGAIAVAATAGGWWLLR